MDGERFDTWAKMLAHTGGRRAAVGLLAGGVFSAAADLLGWDEVAAKKKCPKGKKQCGKYCIAKRLCCRDTDCPACHLCGEKTGKCFSTLPIIKRGCNGCQQKIRCVNNRPTCVTTKKGKPCGPLCCANGECSISDGYHCCNNYTTGCGCCPVGYACDATTKTCYI